MGDTGGFLKYLGFALPLGIVGFDQEARGTAQAGRDRLPVRGRCVLCKRDRAVAYKRGDIEVVCKLCLDDIVASKQVQRARTRRSLLPERPAEDVPDEPWTGESRDWWDRQFA